MHRNDILASALGAARKASGLQFPADEAISLYRYALEEQAAGRKNPGPEAMARKHAEITGQPISHSPFLHWPEAVRVMYTTFSHMIEALEPGAEGDLSPPAEQ